MLAGFTHEPAVNLSEQLAELTGLGHAFYGSDGASATEIALKMSVHFWRNHGKPEKNRFVYLENSYHGETMGALSVTDVAIFRTAYAPLLQENFCTPNPDWRQATAGETAEDVAERAAQSLENIFAEHHQQIAAIILEPLVQGAAGMAMYHPHYLRRVRSLCDQYGVHFIADEIAVGFGRTGTMFACEQGGIRPDLICLSKGITGGYLPLAAVLCGDDIYRAFYHDETARGFLHSHSYTGNPLACAAALATLKIFRDDEIVARNTVKAQEFDELFRDLASHPAVNNWRRTGMIWAFEAADTSAGFAQRFFEAALAQGLLVRPIGRTVYFMPPYAMNQEEASLLAAGTLAALEQTIRPIK